MAVPVSLADQAAARIATVAARAKTLASGVALLAGATAAVTYVVGLLIVPAGWRWFWLVAGLGVCAIPVFATVVAFRRLRTATKTVAETGDDLRAIATDKAVRSALAELATAGRSDQETAPLVQLGKDLLQLRKAVVAHKSEVANLRNSLIAVTSAPGLLAVGTVLSFGLLGLAGVAVVLKLLF